MGVRRAAWVVVVICAACLLLTSASGADTASGAITGVVTDAGSGQPAAYVQIEVRADGIGDYTTCSAADGSYSVSGLASATYTVGFDTQSGFCPTSSPSPSYLSQQVTQAVSSPATATVDASLQPAGIVTGNVTDRLTGAPLRNVPVLAVSTDPLAAGSGGYACTDREGNYTMSAIAPGAYTVEFANGGCSSQDSGFVQQYYPGVSSPSQATTITVGGGTTTPGINAALARDSTSPDGMITGTVTDSATGQPAADVPVEADPNPNTGNYAVACTSSTGAYVIDDLPPGAAYQVAFDPAYSQTCAGEDQYFPVIYNNVPPSITEVGPQTMVANATPVPVTAGSATESINGAVPPAATISGKLTDAGTGQPAPSTVAVVYNSAGTEVASGCTQANGTYTTSILPSGTYRVGFASDPGDYGLCLVFSNTYLPSYYGPAATLAAATKVTVDAPADVTGINGTVVRGSSITGTMTILEAPAPDPPFEGVSEEVELLDSSGAVVDEAPVVIGLYTVGTPLPGTYTFGGLEPGRYLVRFRADGYETQYYSATPVPAAATPITVGEGTTATGIDATMVPLDQTGSISGTVTDATTRLPVGGIVVGVQRPGGPLEGTATTAANGSYTVSGIPSGSYDVAFVDPSKRHLPEFSQDSATAATATPIQVGDGASLTGVNAAIAREATSSTAAVVSPSTITADSGDGVSVELACPAAKTCRGRVSLSVARTKSFAVRTGHVAKLRFTLLKRERAELTRRHRATAVLILRERSRTLHYTITIKARSVR